MPKLDETYIKPQTLKHLKILKNLSGHSPPKNASECVNWCSHLGKQYGSTQWSHFMGFTFQRSSHTGLNIRD